MGSEQKSKDQLHDSSKLDPLFEIDLMYLRENNSEKHFGARCSEQCSTGYVKVRNQNQRYHNVVGTVKNVHRITLLKTIRVFHAVKKRGQLKVNVCHYLKIIWTWTQIQVIHFKLSYYFCHAVVYF